MIPVIDEATGLPIGPEVDARPAPRPRATSLMGRHVMLVPLDAEKHAADLYEVTHGANKEALWLYMGDGPFADARAFGDSLAAKARSEDPLFFTIIEQASGRAVGYITLMRIDPTNRVIEVGNVLYSSAMQRTPGATEAMYLLSRHVFEDLGYRRFEWKCHSLNAPSIAAAKRYGFVYEGMFRQAIITKGRNRDTCWFSMLDGEWPMRKASFERWLDPANFDANGRQKTSLSALNALSVTVGPWTLRRAGPDDVAAIESLQHAAYKPNAAILGTEPIPLRWNYSAIMQRCEVWLAEALGKPVGVLILEMHKDHVMLESVATAPGTQGTGLGGMLLTAAEFRAADYGLKVIRLYTGEKLTRNVDWYRGRGYGIEHIETVDDRRLVHMIKRLN